MHSCAYLLSDQVVAETAARYSHNRPRLDDVSRRAIVSASRPHAPAADCGHSRAKSPVTADAAETTEDVLWLALCAAPEEGNDVSELLRITDGSARSSTGICGHTPKRAALSGSAGDAGVCGGPRIGHRE